MGTNHVGVFYDGIQLSNAQNGQVDLGMFSLDNMQAISLYNGQKSQIFSRQRISILPAQSIFGHAAPCLPTAPIIILKPR